MSDFIIFRHGSNAANQTMTPVAAVGTEEAETAEQAKAQAAERINCYNNQHLEARPVEDCDDADDIIAAIETEMARQAEAETFSG
jgi:hypothetical protein